MKKHVKRIRIRGSVSTVTTSDVYSSDHLPDRFKPLQSIMEIDDFTTMAITMKDIHYSITPENTGEPPEATESDRDVSTLQSIETGLHVLTAAIRTLKTELLVVQGLIHQGEEYTSTP